MSVFVCGLSSNHTSRAISEYAANLGKSIPIWFGSKSHGPHVTHEINEFLDVLEFAHNFTELNIASSDLQEYLFIYTYCRFRFAEYYQRNHQLRLLPFDEIEYALSALVKFFQNNFGFHQIDLGIFGNLPHEGPDLVAYSILKSRGISCLILSQSQFPNKFSMCAQIEEYGQYNPLTTSEPIRIKKSYSKYWWYMHQEKAKSIPAKLLMIFSEDRKFLIKYILATVVNSELKNLYLKAYQNWKKYVQNRQIMCRYTLNDASLRKLSYVYFPLHLQPELTTSALGGRFVDQMLAIEVIHCHLPEGWKIIIKENPKQTPYRRGSSFFKRLSSLRNVIYLTDYSSVELIEHSKFVSTISGSVGWEAISGGKNVLLFGRSWYMDFPGVFKFDPATPYPFEQISQHAICHDDVERILGMYVSSLHTGVVDSDYRTIVADYTITQNNENLLRSLIDYSHSKP